VNESCLAGVAKAKDFEKEHQVGSKIKTIGAGAIEKVSFIVVSHDSFIYVTRVIRMGDMSHSCM